MCARHFFIMTFCVCVTRIERYILYGLSPAAIPRKSQLMTTDLLAPHSD